MDIQKAKDSLIDAKRAHVEAEESLEAFERFIRKHAYSNMIKQSNSQKMNLEFEHAIAQDQENWNKWLELKKKVTDTSLDLFEAQLIWDIAFQQ